MSVSDNIQSLFHPDPSVIRGHLDQLFRRAEAEYGGRFEIAWERADGHWEGRTYPTTQHGFDLAVAEAVAVNEQHLNVYMGVNPRKPDTPPFGRCSAEDVEIAFHQFVDVDTDPSALKLRRAPLPYTWAVTTGRVPNPRPHAYWALEEPTRNMAAWRQQQAALADYFQTDKVIDPARLLRLAGTVSYPSQKKIERGYRVELVTLRTRYDDDAQRDPVSSEALHHAYPPKPDQGAAEPQPEPGADRFDTGRKDPREYVRNIAAGHELHNNATRLAAHLVNTGHRDWLIRDYLDRLLRPVSDGGTLGQIEELIRSARIKYQTADPAPETEDFNAPPPVDLYEPLDFDQLAALPPVSYLIDGILTDYGLSVIYGDPASGKTFLALDMALHLAFGAKWHDRKSNQTGVLYIAGEGARGIAKRISAWRHSKGLQDTNAPFRVLPHAIDFLDLGNVQKLSRTIEHLINTADIPIGLLVIDTVAVNMNGNENDAVDMNRLISACHALRQQFSLAVIGVHHAGKDRERGMRGSTVLPGATDTIVEVTRTESVVCVTVRKQKDDDEPDPFYMEMVKVPTDPLNVQTSLVLKMLTIDEMPNENRNSGYNPTQQQIALIFDEIERAWRTDRPWSNAPQTKQEGRFLPIWIAENTPATLKTAQGWIDSWLMNGALQMTSHDPRSKQRGLRVLFRPGTAYTGTQ